MIRLTLLPALLLTLTACSDPDGAALLKYRSMIATLFGLLMFVASYKATRVWLAKRRTVKS